MFRLPDEARLGWLQEGVSVNWQLHLFKNNVELNKTLDQINDITAASFDEADFPGYSAVTLNSGTWTFAAADPATGEYPEQAFTRSSTGTAQDIYGYYYTRSTGGNIRGYRQWDAPRVVEFSADTIGIRPRLYLDDRGEPMHTGTSVDFRGTTAPDGWLLEDGAAVSRTTYADLFAVIGTTYGSGDGSTTFNLPDSRGRFSLGKATSGTGSILAETGGEIDHTHPLDGEDAHAGIFLDAGKTRHHRLSGLPSWTPNIMGDFTGENFSSGNYDKGTRLYGDTDVSNPPYLVANKIIKT